MAHTSPDVNFSALNSWDSILTDNPYTGDWQDRQEELPTQRFEMKRYCAVSNPAHIRIQSLTEVNPVDDGVTRESVELMQQEEWGGNWGKARPDSRELSKRNFIRPKHR